MPFVGAHELDPEGLDLIRRWIEEMESDSEPQFAELREKSAAPPHLVEDFDGLIVSPQNRERPAPEHFRIGVGRVHF